MFRYFIAFLLLLVTPQCASGDVDVVFGPSPELPAAIVETIRAATWSLDIAIYGLDHPHVLGAIKQASADGVRIRMLVNDADNATRLADKLEGVGVDVRHVNKTLHHKFMICDSRTLMTGSCNWTKTSFASYDEDLLTFKDDQTYVDAFIGEFERLWGGSQEYGKTLFKPTAVVRTKPKFGRAIFTSANMAVKEHQGKNIFSTASKLADGVCGKELIRAIDSAEATVDIATTHFRRQDIAAALKGAILRGVQVRILLDMQEYHPATTKMKDVRYDEELAAFGAEVRYKCYLSQWTYKRALQMHCKYMIVDQRKVLTGSFNWSANSELNSIENLIVLNRPNLTRQYISRFDMKWDYGAGTLPDVLKALKTSKNDSDTPSRFRPIALNGALVARITNNP